jgi:hypothetical protein
MVNSKFGGFIMASAAQVLANRLNAQKSTGPRTPEGKVVVSQNAVRHGLLAREAVIKGEDPGQFESYRDQMLGELAPAGQMESMLAERVVSLSWRLQRAERLQNQAFDALNEKDAPGPLARLAQSLRPKGAGQPQGDSGTADGDSAFGRVIVRDFSHDRVLDRLLMYERRIEHSLYRTMSELQRHRLMRELDPPTAEPTAEAGSVIGKERGRASEACVEGVPPSNRGQDARDTTPDGATTNVPTAEEPSCETNPIPVGASEDQVPCDKDVMNNPSQNGLGKTNPISEGKEPAAWLSPAPPHGDRTGRDRQQTESWLEQANMV